MKKQFMMTLIVLLSLGLLLAGCGGDKAKPAAPASNEIKIGGNFELTGGIANFGKQTVNGIQLAFKEINAAGGVNGKQLKLILADNKSEPAEATNAGTKLITQDKVVAVLGPVASSNVLATL